MFLRENKKQRMMWLKMFHGIASSNQPIDHFGHVEITTVQMHFYRNHIRQFDLVWHLISFEMFEISYKFIRYVLFSCQTE